MFARARHGARGRARRFAAWLGLVAIVAQALLPMLHPTPTQHGVFKVLARASTGPVTAVICTPSGFKLVTLDALPPGEEGTSKKDGGKTRFCPLCQAAHALAVATPPAAPALHALAAEARVALIAAADALSAQPATANLQARAPPLPIG